MQSSLRIIYALIVFVLGIVLLSVLTVLLIYENRQTTLSFAGVTRSHEVRHSLEKLFSNLKDAESSHRSYLLTKDSLFIESYLKLPAMDEQFKNLDSLLAHDPIQRNNAAKLKKLFLKRQKLQENILAKSASAPSSPGALSDLGSDELLMNQIRQLVEQMQMHEQANLISKQKEVTRQSVLPTIIGIGISIFSIIIFILAFYFINTELKKSNHLNDELEKKNVQLEKYTQELSSFTNLTSHDMQEPLRKVELFISLIETRESSSLTPRALEYFGKVKDSVTRMRQLFFSILTFSLADQVRNVREEVDLNEVLRETLESLKVYIKDTNASITSDPLPFVSGVKHQLMQVFQNLISNSLKYKRPDLTPEVKITCEVIEGKQTSLRDLDKDKRYYRIDFRDNGLGFDQKYVDKIFDIFQRHVRTEHGGVGVGLSVCRKIVQNHSGAITAESQINRGSVFSLYLPSDR